MVRQPFEDRRLAAPTCAFETGAHDVHLRGLEDLEDRLSCLHDAGDARALADHFEALERSFCRFVCRLLRSEPLHVDHSGRPGTADLLDRAEQALRPAAVHAGLVAGFSEQRLEIEEAPLVLWPDRDALPVPAEEVEER